VVSLPEAQYEEWRDAPVERSRDFPEPVPRRAPGDDTRPAAPEGAKTKPTRAQPKQPPGAEQPTSLRRLICAVAFGETMRSQSSAADSRLWARCQTGY
jgi:hypothetical protein